MRRAPAGALRASGPPHGRPTSPFQTRHDETARPKTTSTDTTARARIDPLFRSRRRYHCDALTAVLTMLGTSSADAATAVAAIVAARGDRCGRNETAIEFEVVGGRRVHGDMSNNAMLIRSLTDAWLNAMAEFPDVPLLASTNDPTSLDPAVLHLFAFVLAFGDRLSPAQKRLAWSVILGVQPPPGWRPVGASVADVVLAQQRCHMLGALEPAALAASIRAAHTSRFGVAAGRTHSHREPKRLH